MRKRWVLGQATLFVILGIVLVAVFAFALYARNLVVTDKMRAEAQTILSDTIQSNSINYYVENCLKQVSNDAILEAAAKGGTMNFTGKTPWEDYYELEEDGKTYNITYAVKPNDRCKLVMEEPPQYPRDKTYVDDLYQIYVNSPLCRNDALSGFLGKSTLPQLCDLNGANGYSQTKGNLDLTCKPDAYTFMDNSIQRRLQDAINNEIDECINFSVFEDVMGHDINVDLKKKNATIILGKESVLVQATYPFTVTISSGKTVSTSYDFSYKSPYRLRHVYDYVMGLVQKENGIYDFDLKDDYAQGSDYTPSFNTTIIRDACRAGGACLTDSQGKALFDDVLRVVDEDVSVDNRTLMFQVAIRNRNPMLDYIHDVNAGDTYDIKMTENESRTVSPRGYDPDDMDESLSYSYSGWREDYATRLNYTCCSKGPPGEESGWPGKCNMENFKRCTYRLRNEHGEEVEPHNWTNSDIYQATRRDASINVTRNDTGIHNITITVIDDTGLIDYQLIKILVFDLPKAVANGTNGFEGINDSYASVEDPYLLDGSESIASTFIDGDIANYAWRGYDGQGEGHQMTFRFSTDQAQVTTPYDLPAPFNKGFDAIVSAPLNTTQGLSQGPQPYELELYVSMPPPNDDVWSEASTMRLQLSQCLPNRNDTHVYPYPYNDTDVYHYNHTCCLGTTGADGNPSSGDWGTVAGTDVACYNQTSYGQLGALINWVDTEYGNPSVEPTKVTRKLRLSESSPATTQLYDTYKNALPSDDISNDVFKVEFTRNCDGVRGNTCTGDVTAIFTRIETCTDKTNPSDVARCQGPSSGVSTTKQSCHEYDYGTYNKGTFENAFFNTGEDLCNEEQRCSAGPYSYNYDLSTIYDPKSSSYSSLSNRPYLCEGGCYNGECRQSVDCSCSTECGATCDATHRSEMSGEQCNYGCTNGCEFRYKEICRPATYCYGSGEVDNFDSAYCYEAVSRSVPVTQDMRCYAGNSCTDKGCKYSENDLMRKDHCDQCTASGYQQGQYCPAPATVEESGGSLTCYSYGGVGASCSGTSCVNLQSTRLLPEANTCVSQGYKGVRCTGIGTSCCDDENSEDCYSTDEIRGLEAVS